MQKLTLQWNSNQDAWEKKPTRVKVAYDSIFTESCLVPNGAGMYHTISLKLQEVPWSGCV